MLCAGLVAAKSMHESRHKGEKNESSANELALVDCSSIHVQTNKK
jgi:hypothetical protein